MMKSDKSPTTTSSININEIMTQSRQKEQDTQMKSATEKVDDFFQSLELMSKNGPKTEKSSNQPLLPISNILNNLTFNSDEEDLSFNFADDVSLDSLTDDSDEDLRTPASYHTGGKWKPGQGPFRGNRPMFRGKWPPGEAPAQTKAKYYGGRPRGGKNIVLPRDTKTDKIKSKVTKKSFSSDKVRLCTVCNLTFDNRFKYSNHCGSKQHKAKMQNMRQDPGLLKSLVIETVDISRNETQAVAKVDTVGSSIDTAQDADNTKVATADDKHEESAESAVNIMFDDIGGDVTVKTEVISSDDEQELHNYGKDAEEQEGGAQVDDKAGCSQEPEQAEILYAAPIHICTICEKKYANKYLLARHLLTKIHKNRALAQPQDHFRLLQMYHKYIIRFSPYQCAICRYYFNTHNAFEDHIKSELHAENCSDLIGEFLCSLCNFKTHSQLDMQHHIASSDHMAGISKRRKICIVKESHVRCKCKFCGLVMKSFARLKYHVAVKHADRKFVTGVKKKVIGQRNRPVCRRCDKRFACQSALDLHFTRFHSKEKPYGCDICNVKFAGKHAHIVHQRTRKHLNQALSVTSQVNENKSTENDKKKDGDIASDTKMTENSSSVDSTVQEIDDDTVEYESKFEEKKSKRETAAVEEYLTEDPGVESDDDEWHPDIKPSKSKTSGFPIIRLKKKRRKKGTKPVLESKPKTFKCDHCDFTVSAYNDLRPHYMQEHSGKIKVCEICDLIFLSEKALKLHTLSKEHQENIVQSGDTSAGQYFQCHICHKKFTDEKYCKFHTAYKHFHLTTEEAVLKECHGQDVTRIRFQEVLAQAEKLESTDQIKCPECENILKKNNFLEHLRIHTGDRPFQCKMCPKKFASNVTLRRHLLGHFGCMECTCEYCGKEFKKGTSYSEHLKIHLAEQSHKEKLHVCETCGQSFYFAMQLQKHKRRHKEREFACTVPGCHWKFVFRNELKYHMLSHNQLRPYLCDMCGYSAATKCRLKRHYRTHTGERKYHCEYCTYKAGNSTHLHRHMRIHIGSKPFQCPYCDYSCNTHENIRKHILLTRKHAGKKIYPCKFCEYGTNVSKDFRNHILENHNDQLGDHPLDALSVFTGLYNRQKDPKKPEEGTRIIPVKERNTGIVKAEKGGDKNGKTENLDMKNLKLVSGKKRSTKELPTRDSYPDIPKSSRPQKLPKETKNGSMAVEHYNDELMDLSPVKPESKARLANVRPSAESEQMQMMIKIPEGQTNVVELDLRKRPLHMPPSPTHKDPSSSFKTFSSLVQANQEDFLRQSQVSMSMVRQMLPAQSMYMQSLLKPGFGVSGEGRGGPGHGYHGYKDSEVNEMVSDNYGAGHMHRSGYVEQPGGSKIRNEASLLYHDYCTGTHQGDRDDQDNHLIIDFANKMGQ